MIAIPPRLHNSFLLVALILMLGYVLIDLRDGADRHPDPAILAAIITLVLRSMEAKAGPAKPRPVRLVGVAGAIVRRIGTASRRLARGGDRRELARLRLAVSTGARERAMLSVQLREAEARVAMLSKTDRINAVVARLEDATAQLVAAIPTPRRPRRQTTQGEPDANA